MLVLRYAWRELRAGLAGLRILIACLALSVTAITAVGLSGAGVLRALAEDGQEILGGDVALRQLYRPLPAEAVARIAPPGARTSTVAELRAMTRALEPRPGQSDPDSVLVELKAVDAAWPLVGAPGLHSGQPLAQALAAQPGADGSPVYGAVAEQAVLDRLGLAIGQEFLIAATRFRLTDRLDREPDRAGGGTFALGPRVLIADEALTATGLVVEGSLIGWEVRALLPPGIDRAALAESLADDPAFQAIRVREASAAAPGVASQANQLTLFLTLVGLTALLVGGVGIAQAVRAHLQSRTETIATLKSLGAPAGFVVQLYVIQVLALALAATLIGLTLGAAIPFIFESTLAELLPVRFRASLDPAVLLRAFLFGVVGALAFSLWEVGRTRGISAAALFRARGAVTGASPGWQETLGTAAVALLLMGLIVGTSANPRFAIAFIFGSLAAMWLFFVAARGVMLIARRLPRRGDVAWRLALTNLHAPGSATPATTLALGLGLSVLVAIGLVDAGLRGAIAARLEGGTVPSFFLLDIQPDQEERLAATIASVPDARLIEATPMLRGRIIQVDGQPADAALKDQRRAWVLQGDRGMSYMQSLRASDRLSAGSAWAPDYRGPLQVSISDDLAQAFGIGPGAALTVEIVGRPITAQVANVRDVSWQALGVNFTMIFSPGTLEAAPRTIIATAHAPEAEESRLQRALASALPNVSTIAVRDAVRQVEALLGQIGGAVRVTALLTLAVGTLVLMGAIAAGHRRRVYEAVVLKVLGATRGDVSRAFLVEHGLLALVAALIAAGVGTVAAYGVMRFVLDQPFLFAAGPVLLVLLLATPLTLGLGLIATRRALAVKAAPLLRNE